MSVHTQDGAHASAPEQSGAGVQRSGGSTYYVTDRDGAELGRCEDLYAALDLMREKPQRRCYRDDGVLLATSIPALVPMRVERMGGQ